MSVDNLLPHNLGCVLAWRSLEVRQPVKWRVARWSSAPREGAMGRQAAVTMLKWTEG
jgi:hypothetical protein